MKKLFVVFICISNVFGGQIVAPQEREEIAALDTVSYGTKEQELWAWREDETGQERREERLRQQEEAVSEEPL